MLFILIRSTAIVLERICSFGDGPPSTEAVVHLSHRLAAVGPFSFASVDVSTRAVTEALTRGLPPRCLQVVKLFQDADTFGAPKGIAPNPHLHLARHQRLFRAGATLGSTSMSWIANAISSMQEKDDVPFLLPADKRVLPEVRSDAITIALCRSPPVLLPGRSSRSTASTT